jgi:hypothetical protein
MAAKNEWWVSACSFHFPKQVPTLIGYRHNLHFHPKTSNSLGQVLNQRKLISWGILRVPLHHTLGQLHHQVMINARDPLHFAAPSRTPPPLGSHTLSGHGCASPATGTVNVQKG